MRRNVNPKTRYVLSGPHLCWCKLCPSYLTVPLAALIRSCTVIQAILESTGIQAILETPHIAHSKSSFLRMQHPEIPIPVKWGRWSSFPPSVLQIFCPEYHWLRLVPIRQRPWNHSSSSGTGAKPRHQTGTWGHKNYSHPIPPLSFRRTKLAHQHTLKAISRSNTATLKKFLTVHKTWR